MQLARTILPVPRRAAAPFGAAESNRLLRGQSRAAAALVLLLGLFHVLYGETVWAPVQNLLFDSYQRWMPRRVSRFPVAIIDIDDRSLAAHGRWPWPRTLLAELIERVHGLGALAIGLDMILPEADNLSPARLLAGRTDLSAALIEALEKMPSNDSVLAGALRKTPSIVARAALSAGGTKHSAAVKQTPVIFSHDPPPSLLPSLPAEITNLAELDEAAAGRGYVNDSRDRDGVVRRLPLLLTVNDVAAPSLAIEILRVAAGAEHYRVRSNGAGVLGVEIGDSFVATDADGRLRIYFSPAYAARRISAAAILAGELEKGALANQVALVGATAVGTGDVLPTPMAGRMDGVEIQAQLIENILGGGGLARAPAARGWEAAASIAFGLLLIFVLPRRSPSAGWAIFIGGAALLGLTSLGLFHRHQILFDPTFPAAANGLIILTLLTTGINTSERRRRELDAALESEKVERVRVAAELKAARDIQMGMLPDPRNIEGLPPTVDFFALLEPAQEVGGDLYDAFMLDRRRLFFMIGDVSGKGVPASLFMALTKTLAKTLARREHACLERLLESVNEGISRENTASMFVTAIIGVMDTETGEVELCNAGHNAPILLRPGNRPRQIDGAAGPPLCVDENFRYRSQRLRLEAGDMLLFITDGVSEAEDEAQAQYGLARVLDFLAATQPTDAASLCTGLHAEVKSFSAASAPSDDLTIVAMRFLPAK